MGPVVPFIPHIISGAGALGGALFGKKQGQPSAGEQAMAGQSAANAAQLGGQARSLFAYGNPLLQQSGNYYSRLLTGGRGAVEQAIQPERSMITDTYRGAESSLERSGVRGPSRDLAMAQLSRDRAGKIASLIPNARAGAAAATADLGRFGTSQAGANLGGASSIYSSLLGGARDDRQIAHKQGGEFGSAIGGLLADVMKTQSSKKNASA